jgi:hypothetical protein
MSNTIQKTEIINLKALKWAIKNYSSIDIDRQTSQSLENIQYQKTDLAVLKKILSNCRKNETMKTEYTQKDG